MWYPSHASYVVDPSAMYNDMYTMYSWKFFDWQNQTTIYSTPSAESTGQ